MKIQEMIYKVKQMNISEEDKTNIIYILGAAYDPGYGEGYDESTIDGYDDGFEDGYEEDREGGKY